MPAPPVAGRTAEDVRRREEADRIKRATRSRAASVTPLGGSLALSTDFTPPADPAMIAAEADRKARVDAANAQARAKQQSLGYAPTSSMPLGGGLATGAAVPIAPSPTYKPPLAPGQTPAQRDGGIQKALDAHYGDVRSADERSRIAALRPSPSQQATDLGSISEYNRDNRNDLIMLHHGAGLSSEEKAGIQERMRARSEKIAALNRTSGPVGTALSPDEKAQFLRDGVALTGVLGEQDSRAALGPELSHTDRDQALRTQAKYLQDKIAAVRPQSGESLAYDIASERAAGNQTSEARVAAIRDKDVRARIATADAERRVRDAQGAGGAVDAIKDKTAEVNAQNEHMKALAAGGGISAAADHEAAVNAVGGQAKIDEALDVLNGVATGNILTGAVSFFKLDRARGVVDEIGAIRDPATRAKAALAILRGLKPLARQNLEHPPMNVNPQDPFTEPFAVGAADIYNQLKTWAGAGGT